MGFGGSGPLPSSGNTELERLRRAVGAHFPVYETRLGPQSVLFAVHIDRTQLAGRFDALRQELWSLGYIPFLRREMGEDFIEVLRRPKTGRTRLWINLLLLAGTVATTTFAGGVIWLTYVGGLTLTFGDFLNGAIYFAAPVMTILGLHEFAHYAVARREHLDASLPYFMPIPPPFLFGTLGAFVSIREPFPDKKALFDIGASGPLTGFVASIPIVMAGLYLSVHAPVLPASYCGPTILGTSYGNLLIGTPLIWELFSLFFPPGLANLHPLALAGWVGIFVTAINLLPAGQLDGGHVFRALFGDRTRYVSYGIVLFLFGIGIFTGYVGWWLFALFVLFTGLRHPPPLNDQSPLTGSRYALGALALGILITGFALVPIAVPPGAVSIHNASASPASLPPGAAVAANLSLTISNDDPIPHGYLFSTSFANVSSANGTTNLTGSALRDWEANTTWTLFLSGGETVTGTGATVTTPASQYVTINATGSHDFLLRITVSNPAASHGAGIEVTVTQLCATSGTGTASQAVRFGFT